MTDEEIEAQARASKVNPPLTQQQLASMEIVWPEPKTLISLRLDGGVIRWFKDQGPGYQTRINSVLRAYILAMSRRSSRSKSRRSQPKSLKRVR
jgi:uncharacterized protein (DUF4415 family)